MCYYYKARVNYMEHFYKRHLHLQYPHTALTMIVLCITVLEGQSKSRH
jgi:hypothetical protein